MKLSLEEQQHFREELKRVKTLSRELIQQRNLAKEAKKQRRKENLQKKRENEAKSETLQVVRTLSALNSFSSFNFRDGNANER